MDEKDPPVYRYFYREKLSAATRPAWFNFLVATSAVTQIPEESVAALNPFVGLALRGSTDRPNADPKIDRSVFLGFWVFRS